MKTDRMPFCCEARGHIFFIATPNPNCTLILHLALATTNNFTSQMQ
jgi:hypothetical protein